MDLKDNKITLKELYKNPKALEIFEREFGDMVHHPMVKASFSMPLSKMIGIAKKKLPPEKIEQILKELENI